MEYCWAHDIGGKKSALFFTVFQRPALVAQISFLACRIRTAFRLGFAFQCDWVEAGNIEGRSPSDKQKLGLPVASLSPTIGEQNE